MRETKKAFTLIETLMSLFILSVALVGAFAVIMSNNKSASFIKNSFIASGLAQEGMEVVRNIRDSDWHAGAGFGTGLDPANGVVYCVQWNTAQISGPCSDTKLLKDGNGMYSHDSGSPTIFSRSVFVQPGQSADEIVVVIAVSWRESTGTKEIKAEQHLFNWY